MRRDVRLLGDVLGEVITESDGPDLLADVERLRHAVISARQVPDRASPAAAAAGDAIAALVASWSRTRAEQVARAFTVYFHLANLAEEQQRVRTLRSRDAGDTPPRESFADAVARVTGLLAAIDDQPASAAQQAEARRRLREEVDLLWRTAQLRVTGMTPADEVRTVMTAFDETLFLLVPAVYRALDQALLGAESGRAPSPVPAFLRFGSWVGADRDGNPLVTAAVTREASIIQADHALRALGAACSRIGRALTVNASGAPPSAQLRRALAAASAAHPELVAEISARSPQEP